MVSNVTIKVHVKTRGGKHNTLKTQPGQDTLMHVLRDEDQGVEAVCGGCSSCTTRELFLEDLACGISMLRSVSVLMSHASTSRNSNIFH